MTDPKALVERLVALFMQSFQVEVPSPDTDLLESGLLDSFQVVELLAHLESEFGLRITIDDLELDDLRTLERIAHLVAAGGARAAQPQPL